MTAKSHAHVARPPVSASAGVRSAAAGGALVLQIDEERVRATLHGARIAPAQALIEQGLAEPNA